MKGRRGLLQGTPQLASPIILDFWYWYASACHAVEELLRSDSWNLKLQRGNERGLGECF